jgi:hypothetical protein
MKKSFFCTNAIVAVVIMFSLSACKKENTNSASPLYQATISGKAWATFDESITNAVQPVPAGTKIYAAINTEDLVINPNSSLTYATKIYSTTTSDANGSYSFKIDTNVKTVTVDIYSDDFIHDHKAADNTTTSGIWRINPSSYEFTVTKDVILIQDIQFTEKSTKE